MGIEIACTRVGITIAMIFVGIPFIVRTVQLVLEKLDRQYEEAAHMLGQAGVICFCVTVFYKKWISLSLNMLLKCP